MDTQFKKQVTKALKLKRAELQEQLVTIASVLEELNPPKVKRPEAPRSALEQNTDKLLLAMQAGNQYTREELKKASGIYMFAALDKAIEALVIAKKIRVTNHGGYTHYQLKQDELRLIAGEGKVA